MKHSAVLLSCTSKSGQLWISLPGSGHRLLSGQRAGRLSVATVAFQVQVPVETLLQLQIRLDVLGPVNPAMGMRLKVGPSRAAGRELNYPDC